MTAGDKQTGWERNHPAQDGLAWETGSPAAVQPPRAFPLQGAAARTKSRPEGCRHPRRGEVPALPWLFPAKRSQDSSIAERTQLAPTVDPIDLSGYTGQAGETIRITASDDFEVTGGGVSITGAGGTALEHGAATASDGAWSHVTKAALPAGQQVSIEVTATDRPGHETTNAQSHA